VGAGAAHAAEYQRSWLASDLMAGLVLTALLVPVGMGYAQAAGLPPISGLYATIVPLVAYAVFGPSRVMVLGPDSSPAAVIVAVILLLRRFWRAVPGVMVTVLVGIAAVADTTVLSQSLAAQRDKTVDPTRSSVPSAPPTWPPACPGLRHLQQRLPHPVAVAAGARSHSPLVGAVAIACCWWPRRAPCGTCPCRCWPRSSSPPPSA
jgi:MFS superfamily sulfate permease-like transporter